MRERKYQAWGCFGSEKTNHMVINWQDSEYIEYVGFNGGGFFTLREYTGLKINGVEVFEYDIVKDENGKIGLVIFDSDIAGFCLLYYPLGHYGVFKKGLCLIDRDESTIIGNQFENPYLLEIKL